MDTLAEHLLGTKREAAPRLIRLAIRELEHGRHDWVRAVGLGRDARKPGQSISIPGLQKLDEQKRRAAYLEYLDEHTPSLTATIEDNVVDVKLNRVTRLSESD